VGSATTPHLQVAPLFAIHGLPKTPNEGCAAPRARAPALPRLCLRSLRLAAVLGGTGGPQIPDMPLFGLLMEPCVYGGQPLVRTWHRGNAALTGTSARAARRRARAGLTPRGARRDRYAGGAGSATTRKELAALFAVIGTPSWADVEAVRAGSWRSYLQRLPGRAPTLYRRLAACAGAARGPSCPLRPRTVFLGTLTARSARRMAARLLSGRTRPVPACTRVRAANALVGRLQPRQLRQRL